MTDTDAPGHAHPTPPVPAGAHVVGAAPGPVLTVLEHGATVHRLEVTGGDGVRRNVVLGHPTPAAYLASTAFIGGSIGRYANRIAGGTFELDGVEVQVGTSDRGNHLHGGPDGFDRRPWTLAEHDDDAAVLRLTSPDGDQGFPGTLEVEARFVVDATSVRLELLATTDATTVVNLTSHAYFNLEGEGSGSVDHHELRVAGQAFHETDDTGIPLPGPASPVAGTPFDLTTARPLGDVVRQDHPQLLMCRGIDHDYVLDGDGLRDVAWLHAPRVGSSLRLRTDQPGLQVYTGNGLDGTAPSSTGGRHRQGDGVALEPQRFPDTPNRPDFGDATLRPGDTYRCRVEWHFDPR